MPQTDRYVWRLAKRGEQPEDLRLEVEWYTTGHQPKQHHHHLPLLVLTERHTAVLILKKNKHSPLSMHKISFLSLKENHNL